MAVDFKNFESYYGGTSVDELKKMLVRENDPRYKKMFADLINVKQSGGKYIPSTNGGQLHYIKEGLK